MSNYPFPVSPLSLDPMTSDYWGSFDAAIIAQLAPLAENDCYQPKIYRAPAVSAEVMAAGAYVSYGLKITPGSIIYGFYLPPASPTSDMPSSFNVQITDLAFKGPNGGGQWWDQAIPSYFLGNAKLTYLAMSENIVGAFPNLLDAPYPVVGKGLFSVEIWNTSGGSLRVELVFGVLEAVGACK
jgi:hypothetical protein